MRYTLEVRGKTTAFCLDVELDREQYEAMTADGIYLGELVNTVPQWVQMLGLTDAWCWLQDKGVIRL